MIGGELFALQFFILFLSFAMEMIITSFQFMELLINSDQSDDG